MISIVHVSQFSFSPHIIIMTNLTNILSLNVEMSCNLAGLTNLLSINPVDLIL